MLWEFGVEKADRNCRPREFQVLSVQESELCVCAATVDLFVDNQIPLYTEPYPANQERLLQTGYDKVSQTNCATILFNRVIYRCLDIGNTEREQNNGNDILAGYPITLQKTR